MKAFPCLTKIVMKLLCWKNSHKRCEVMKPTKCPHPSFKEVEVEGYTVSTNDVELITYFIENAVSLEKITTKSFQYKDFYRCGHTLTMEEEDMAKNHVKEKIPSTIEFICP